MEQNDHSSSRRKFISKAVGATAALGLAPVLASASSIAAENKHNDAAAAAEKWFRQVKKKHRMVFDWPKHNNGTALGWALTLMNTYNDLGVDDDDIALVIVLRYATTPLALADPLWEEYGIGKRLEIKDPSTKEFATKNIYAKCISEDDNCIELFQRRGGLVCVCNQALTHYAESLADQLKQDKAVVKQQFLDNLLPGIQLMPSGIWAVNRAQELGCTLCAAG